MIMTHPQDIGWADLCGATAMTPRTEPRAALPLARPLARCARPALVRSIITKSRERAADRGDATTPAMPGIPGMADITGLREVHSENGVCTLLPPRVAPFPLDNGPRPPRLLQDFN